MRHRSEFIKSALLLLAVLVTFLGSANVRAEGSWQMGLFEGLSFRQPLYETNANANRSVLRVDILNPGEVINALACGTDNTNRIRVLMYNPAGALVYNSTTTANVDCSDDFTGDFDPAVVNAHQHTTATTGAYEVHLANLDGTRLDRFDVTVTNNVTDIINPRENGGRLWSDYWYFWAGSFAQSRSTDADLYVVADGGFTGTYFVWKLDLNNFAGFGYGLKANSLGVQSPNAAGDVVAGMSVPSSGNAIVEEYPIYLSYPATSYPLPTQSYTVSPLVFLDDQNIDSAISAGGNGAFYFSTDYNSMAVYEIIIDTSNPSGGAPDGIYGRGDVFLRGTAWPGDNTVPWDGKDNNGNDVPLGAYSARVSVRTGEFHFVADDVETSGGPNDVGLKMYRIDPDGTESPTTLFWDDHTVLNSTAPDAFNQTGIYDGDHNWGAFNSGGVGNVALIDTYTYGISVSPNPAPVAIVPDDRPLATLVKSFSPSTITSGQVSSMQFEITNNGTTTMTGITVSDSMPFGMTLVSDPSAITVTGAGCSGFDFSPDTVTGGDQLDIIDGTITGGSTCVVTADVTATMPGNMANSTSAVTSNELPFGVGSNVASLVVEPDVSGAPFACDANMYEVETVGNTSRLYTISPDVLPYSRNEFSGASYAPSTEFRYTGLAWHPQENYLYGIVSESTNAIGVPGVGSVVRIDASGKVVDLGVPTLGPNTMSMPMVSDRFTGGTFSADGSYVVVTDNSPTSNAGATIPFGERALILEIDVSVSPPQVLYNRPHGRDLGDVVAHPNGSLYTHTAAEGLLSINSQTGAVSAIGGDVSVPVSSLMADNWGAIYAHTEGTAELLQIDIATGNGTPVSTLAGGVTADGASCAYGVGVRKSVATPQVEAGDAATYTVSLVNAGNSAVTIDFTDNLQDNRSFVDGSLVNTTGGTVNTYGATKLLTIAGMTLPANSTSAIEFDVLYPSGYPAGFSDNQATVLYSGSAIASDNPSTAIIGDPTPIEVLPSPGLGVSKRAEVSGSEITYWFNVVNTGSVELQSLALSDDLDAVFGAGNFTVLVAPTLVEDPGSVTVTTAFTGSGAGIALIDSASNSVLQPGARAVVRLTIRVDNLTDRGSGYAVYSNQVTATAETALGNPVADDSVDGDSVDPDGDGSADEQSPTVVDLSAALSVSGIVFEDNGISATAHDGIQAGGETPLGGMLLELRDSNGAVLNTTTTDSSGRYTFQIPFTAAGSVLQVVAVPASGLFSVSERYAANGTANVADSAVSFVVDPNATDTLIDFGMVRAPRWLSDNVAENSPDTVVFHPHTYRASSEGQLEFSYTAQSTFPENPGFSALLYLDDNCNGVADATETTITSPLPVAANQQVCVVNKVYIPANAANDDTHTASIAATLLYSDPLNTGHSVTSTLQLTDISRAVASGQGVLTLDKTVQNLSDGTAVSTSNSAAPGDVLGYTIDFRNSGTGPVTELLIADSTPAFSVLESSVQCPVTMPDGISACQVLLPSPSDNGPGYDGPIQWRFNGPLSAGAMGQVSFEIRVE